MIIYATLIDNVAAANAATWYNDNISKVKFGNYPDDGALQRTIYFRGSRRFDEGNGAEPTYYVDDYVFFWSTTPTEEDGVMQVCFGYNNHLQLFHYKEFSFNVRLFRDN